jgi:uncharacterized protein YndB with AHSA1/START domain
MSDENPEASAASALDSRRVSRSVDVDAGADEVWTAISDPELRALWLDDDDARSRQLRLDEVDDGRRLVWTWWRPDDEPSASRVEILLAPTADGTRVVITETLAAASVGVANAAPGAAPAHLRAADRWTHRLLGLELLFVAAGVLVR